jgi:hypothetical protein
VKHIHDTLVDLIEARADVVARWDVVKVPHDFDNGAGQLDVAPDAGQSSLGGTFLWQRGDHQSFLGDIFLWQRGVHQSFLGDIFLWQRGVH